MIGSILDPSGRNLKIHFWVQVRPRKFAFKINWSLGNLSKSHFHWFEKRETPKLINCYVPPSINTKSDHQLEKWLWPISSDNSTTPQDDRVPRIVQKLFFLFHFLSFTIGNVKKCAQDQWFSLLYRILEFCRKSLTLGRRVTSFWRTIDINSYFCNRITDNLFWQK